MKILNKVKDLKVTDAKTFLTWEFNTLKDDKRDVTKLKNAIKQNGWSFPVFVWADHNFVIDGAGRKKAVIELISEGYEITEIPYVEIEADSIEQAKAKVLEVSSQYGIITTDSFLEFTEGIELDFDLFELQGIDKDLLNEPENLTEDKNKVDYKIQIKFQTKEDLENAKFEIEDVCNRYDNVFISVTGNDQ
jgi:hypothetical protein